MRTSLFVSTSIAAVLAISFAIVPALAAGTYKDVIHFRVSPVDNRVGYTLVAGDDIPKTANSYINSQLVFGYAWLKTGTTPIKAVVAAIHPGFTDSAFSPGSKWHAHTATLVSGSSGSLCVSAIDSPNFKLAIVDEKLGMLLKKSSNTINSAVAATSFVLTLQGSSGDCPYVEVPFYNTDGTFTLTAVKLKVTAPAP